MAKHHSARARVELFRKGWLIGASKRAIPDKPPSLKSDEDFQAGYLEGCEAFTDAMSAVRKRYGAGPPVILRLQDVENDL